MATLRLATHDSGSGWFATPFLYDSFIHDSTPVYPGARHGLLDLRVQSRGMLRLVSARGEQCLLASAKPIGPIETNDFRELISPLYLRKYGAL